MSASQADDLESRLIGCLLGTAIGDALGLPAEGMTAAAIARRFGRMERYRLIGRTGFVSDDTEQAALVAQSLIRSPSDPVRCAQAFRRSLLGWFLRLPWGIGFATLRACLRIALGFSRSGVPSAGNGAAMRAAIIGVYFRDDPTNRSRFVEAISEVTHTHPLAIDGARFAADLAAECSNARPDFDRGPLMKSAVGNVRESTLSEAIRAAVDLAESNAPVERAARELGTSGYSLHTLPFAAFCFLQFGRSPALALEESIGAGGDTDSIGAILGAWLGALHGESGLPPALVQNLNDGPFGPTHLRCLAADLARISRGEAPREPGYSPIRALARNLALYPVILAHGFRRLLP